MDAIQFADGFDTPDRLAFGLGAAQLTTVVGGGAVTFLLLRLPLPVALTAPMALVVAILAAALGWLRLGRRPAIDWALFAVHHAARRRDGSIVITQPRSAAPGRAMSLTMPSFPDPPARAASDEGWRAANVIPLHRAQHAAPAVAPARVAGACATGGDNAHRVVFFSLKGGAGRTTLATEVAVALAMHRDVRPGGAVLIDLDVRNACVGTRLGINGPGILDYALAAPDERRIADHVTLHGSGLRVVLGPARPLTGVWPLNPPVVREALRELDIDGAQIVVIDASPQLDDVTRAVLQAADDIMVVLAPTATGVQAAYSTTEQLRRMGLRRQLRYVVNRARGGVDVSVAIADLGGQLIAEIPEDPALVEAENAHEPLVLHGGGATSAELRRLATRLLPSPSGVAVP